MFVAEFRNGGEVEVKATRWERTSDNWFDFYDDGGIVMLTIRADEVLSVDRKPNLEPAAV